MGILAFFGQTCDKISLLSFKIRPEHHQKQINSKTSDSQSVPTVLTVIESHSNSIQLWSGALIKRW